MSSLRTLLETGYARLAAIGADGRDDEEVRERKSLLVLVSVLILPVSLLWGGLYLALPLWFTTVMLALNIAVGGTIVFTLLALFAKQRAEALAALRLAQDQAESLLLNVLPRPIADRLKAEPQTIADQFPSASILFADVVEFTRRSEKLSPGEVVGILDHLFSHFDMLAERYAVEKIKTIGDCYMVAAGVPSPRSDTLAPWRSWRSTWSMP